MRTQREIIEQGVEQKQRDISPLVKIERGKYGNHVEDSEQGTLFGSLSFSSTHTIEKTELSQNSFHLLKNKNDSFQLQNRRYVGNKYKLIDWIFSIINRECEGSSFTDIFAGTGIVAAAASRYFDRIVLNDFLHSNHVIYKAFFGNSEWNQKKLNTFIEYYNALNPNDLHENYFSVNFGGKYFSKSSAKLIGYIREHIEENKGSLADREYTILLTSLLYSADRIANTVGHYDAYFKNECREDTFYMRLIDPIAIDEVTIFKEDANLLARNIQTDVVYIDPPYNSRQYSRFYHILETLVKWDKPKLYGVALKPEPENMSDYCRIDAVERFAELVRDIDAKYVVVSYNNTYASKSSSSKNKITLEEIAAILGQKGLTKIFDTDYRHFNAGNTNFNNHKEYLFVTTVNHG